MQPDNPALLEQLSNIAAGISQTFAPFCEVVVHDLKNPEHAIHAIYNNLSGRQAGDPATELGLARIASPDFPNLLVNYPNQFVDGRPVKSTSIGIKDDSGEYVAALCLNVDMTMFKGMQNMLAQFTQLDASNVNESLEPAGTEAIKRFIDQYAARLATSPRALKIQDRKQLIRDLKATGLLDVKKAMETIAQHLGISRASVYIYAKKQPETM